MKKDLLTIHDLSAEDVEHILERSAALKRMLKQGTPYQPLNKNLLRWRRFKVRAC